MSNRANYTDLDKRAREVFKHIVENFMQDGLPVGSRKVAQNFPFQDATARNIMSDLELAGFLEAPHTSAGRLPTDHGLRCFVDGIMEKGELSEIDRAALEAQCKNDGTSAGDLFENASAVLSGLSASAGLVVAPTQSNKTINHIEFVSLGDTRTIVVLVASDGTLENRVIDLAPGITPEMLREASQLLSERLHGRTVSQMRDAILAEITQRRDELGAQVATLIESGLASKLDDGKLIVRGRSQLLQDPSALQSLDRVKSLMEQLESKETVSKLLEEATNADGVKIYIGSENSIFQGSGHSLILSPYRNDTDNIVGAIGVIGPTRLNYAKIIPSVNFMAEMLTQRIKSL